MDSLSITAPHTINSLIKCIHHAEAKYGPNSDIALAWKQALEAATDADKAHRANLTALNEKRAKRI